MQITGASVLLGLGIGIYAALNSYKKNEDDQFSASHDQVLRRRPGAGRPSCRATEAANQNETFRRFEELRREEAIIFLGAIMNYVTQLNTILGKLSNGLESSKIL